MITCREVISFLLEYLEGSLPDDEAKRFAQHLELCASCIAYLRTYETTVRMGKYAAADDTDIPEDLVRAVVAARLS